MTVKTLYRQTRAPEVSDYAPKTILRAAITSLEGGVVDQTTWNLRSLDPGSISDSPGSIPALHIYLRTKFSEVLLEGVWISPYTITASVIATWFLYLDPVPGITLIENNSEATVTIKAGLYVLGQEQDLPIGGPGAFPGAINIAPSTKKWIWIKDRFGSFEEFVT